MTSRVSDHHLTLELGAFHLLRSVYVIPRLHRNENGSRGDSSGKPRVSPPAPCALGLPQPPNPSAATLSCSGRYSAPARGCPPSGGAVWVFMCADRDAQEPSEWFIRSMKQRISAYVQIAFYKFVIL